MTTLSIAMMVKDEEKYLAQCLTSVMAFDPDEIVIVDTGSKDRTIEIAKSFGATVIIPDNLDEFFVRTGYGPKLNFGKTRNYSFSFCSGDWILQVDADETIKTYAGQPPERFRQFLSRVPEEYNCVGFLMEDVRSGRDQRIKMNVPRCFRNGKVTFTEIVHNEPHWEGSGTYYPFLRMYHYGYDITGDEKKAKGERLCGLLEKRIEDNPEDFDAMFYLAQAYGVHDDVEKSLYWGEKYANALPEIIASGKNQFGVIHYLIATTYLNEGNLEKCKQWLEIGLQYAPSDIDLNWTKLRLGLKAQNSPTVMAASRQFVISYEQFDRETSHDTSRIVYNHNLGCYSLALFYSSMSMLETMHASLEKLDMAVPHAPAELQQEIRGGVENMLKKLKIEWNGAKNLKKEKSGLIIVPSGVRLNREKIMRG
jgi:glycosyltransferase involved in cell wall biosynthesis